MKTDFKKEYKHLYAPLQDAISLVEVPAFQFLMLDGQGDPNTSEAYQEALVALFGLAYGCKFASAKELDQDYTVMPLEGLWWTPDMADFSVADKSAWYWTMMIMQPDWVTDELISTVRASLQKKKSLARLAEVRLERFEEGEAVQILHVGGYDEEAPVIAALHAYADEQGYVLRDKHHEIYLSDPRRTAPEKLKTVLRQPVRKA